jgi:hypothetical protein
MEGLPPSMGLGSEPGLEPRAALGPVPGRVRAQSHAGPGPAALGPGSGSDPRLMEGGNPSILTLTKFGATNPLSSTHERFTYA